MESEKLTCSIGVMAYNEEANIAPLLEALLKQNLSVCSLQEICVVASGCTDRTEDIVRVFMRRDARIKLLVQKQRQGKASAINLYLSQAPGDVFIIESGDTQPDTDTIEKLVKPFLDPGVGMTGGRPVPVNSENTFVGFTVHLLWNLHHRISLVRPKLGELVAFRNVVREIPNDTAVDEASIEAIIRGAGLRLVYIGEARVFNKGAENVRDFLKQRRRIAIGHLHLKHKQDYSVSTTSWKNILGPLIRETRWGGKTLAWTMGEILLEIYARASGHFDFFVRKRNPFVWDIAASTKDLTGRSK